jgi:hypothetical protein
MSTLVVQICGCCGGSKGSTGLSVKESKWPSPAGSKTQEIRSLYVHTFIDVCVNCQTAWFKAVHEKACALPAPAAGTQFQIEGSIGIIGDLICVECPGYHGDGKTPCFMQALCRDFDIVSWGTVQVKPKAAVLAMSSTNTSTANMLCPTCAGVKAKSTNLAPSASLTPSKSDSKP